MPINYFQPLDSLRNLPNSGFKYKAPDYGVDSTDDTSAVGAPGGVPNIDTGQFHSDPNSNLELASLQDQRLSELKDNAAKGLRMAAPGNSQSELESDIASNPLTAQHGQVEDYMKKRATAQLSGFHTPQEAAGYGRSMEEEKMRQPVTLAGMNNQTELQKQTLANQGSLAVAGVNADALKDRYDADFLKTLALIGGRGDVASNNNYSKQLAELDKQHTIGVGGRRISDEEYTRRKAELTAGRNQSSGAQGGGHTPRSFAESMRRDYPQASLNDLMTMSQSPDNSMGGIDDPDELNQLRQHFISLGAK
jgi:hypothetical protein